MMLEGKVHVLKRYLKCVDRLEQRGEIQVLFGTNIKFCTQISEYQLCKDKMRDKLNSSLD